MSDLPVIAEFDDPAFLFDALDMTFDGWITDPDSVVFLHGSFSSVIALNGAK